MVEYMKAEEASAYLNELALLVGRVNSDFGNVLAAHADYKLKVAEKLNSSANVVISDSGFPSVPSLNEDLKRMQKETEAYSKLARKKLAMLKTGNYTSADQKELEMAGITVPSGSLESFLKNINTGSETVNYHLEDKDGWVELTRRSKQNVRTEKQNEQESIIVKNLDEIAALGVSAVGSIFFWPLIFGYPAFVVLKASKNEKKISLLATDIISKIKNKKEAVEQKEVKYTDEDAILLKYFSGDFAAPILVHEHKGKLGICSLNKELEQRLFFSVRDNLLIKGALAYLTYWNHSDDTLTALEAENAHTEEADIPTLKLLESLEKKKGFGDTGKELYRLNNKEKKGITELFMSLSGAEEIIIPENIFVDKLGALYPSPILWLKSISNGDEKALKEFQENFTGYLFNEKAPLSLLNKNLKFRCNNIESSGILSCFGRRGTYFLINSEQLNLPEPVNVMSKFTDAIPYYDFRKNTANLLKQLSADRECRHLFSAPSIITNNSVFGNAGDCVKLSQKIQSTLSDTESRLDSLSKDTIKGNYARIFEMQKELVEKYGRGAKKFADAITDFLHAQY